MNRIAIKGYGYYVPENKVVFEDQIRRRVVEETQLEMAAIACRRALENAGMKIEEIDLLVSASAVGIQPIPCTAALIHEQVARGLAIPAMDINTTCTSFISALDTVSYMVEAGRYRNVLIVSSEVGSQGLNPKQKESFELFADGAAAFVFSRTEDEQGVMYALQETWSEGAHTTEIRGGLTGFHPKYYSEETKEEYMFDMEGKKILLFSLKRLPLFLKRFEEESGLSMDDIDMYIPHQASRALELAMKKLGIPENKYINLVQEYGNMVSVSVPFALCKALEEKKVEKGNKLALFGTAAGLTINLLVLKI
ncbi:MAG: 3-oxoacyl-[acyl-carrier-protein] synthase III C-terminal domain-containing protein [Eubacteriales bacterium]|nr:3-oxoacyl-[acyl-carrier-protein] synthase III C-terminal domain-containing protein [Eubacteriales bacterium]